MTLPATLHGVPLGALRLGAPLGTGARGQTWAATTAAGERVVVSVLGAGSPERQDARLRRIDAVRTVDHPGLVRVLPVAEDADERLVVTELVTGPTLTTVRTARLGLRADEAVTLARDLAGAVAALHRVGVVHGDVAPENVVLRADDGDPRPVLLDLASDVGAEAGTSGFAAPEVREGGAAVPASDVWSIGTLAVWSAAAGERDEVTRAVAGALAADPVARPTAERLARLLDGWSTPVRVPPPSVLAGAALRRSSQTAPTALRPTRRRRPARHRRRTVIRPVMAAVLVALLAVGGWTARQLWPGVAPASVEAAVAVRVGELVALRDRALVSADGAALAALSVPGSVAAEADAALLERLEADGTVLADLRTGVEVVDVAVGEAEARIRVTLVQGTHLRTSGGVSTTVAATAPRCADLTLARAPDGWRVAAVDVCDGT